MRSHSTSTPTSTATSGEGATRHCDIAGLGGKTGTLEERAFDWRKSEGFKIDIYESNLLLKSNGVTFSLEDAGSGSRVSVTPNYVLKFDPIGVFMDKMMVKRQFEQGIEGLLAGLKYNVETGNEVDSEVPST